ncbi:MAG: hypothetical protein OJF59_002976 [Cytophagales bacterium]|nr:hypothetical protein [Bacteroidota bacterium]MBS1979579.1 hypothetical protein [Bacteroidota bacterium]WHZ09220.1 MAG: hypothetical protein OJF59_002976 [Cytophagales bacterium]
MRLQKYEINNITHRLAQALQAVLCLFQTNSISTPFFSFLNNKVRHGCKHNPLLFYKTCPLPGYGEDNSSFAEALLLIKADGSLITGATTLLNKLTTVLITVATGIWVKVLPNT